MEKKSGYASLTPYFREDGSLKREEILSMAFEQEYGWLKECQYTLSFRELAREKWGCGNITKISLTMDVAFTDDMASVPFTAFLPVGNSPCPVFLYLGFDSLFPGECVPVEEICDQGFGLVAFDYQDVAKDQDDQFAGTLERMLIGPRSKNTAGKIRLWAEAASMIMNHVVDMEEVDKENIAVAGHSRLGKAALLVGALDQRFKYTIVNESGCGGASLNLNRQGESIAEMTRNFPWWYAENFKRCQDNHVAERFDQHFILALTAPRYLYVASAAQDTGADIEGEYMACVLADEAYKKLGKKGFVGEGLSPDLPLCFLEGDIGYHLRPGQHFLSRFDWRMFMKFINLKRNL